MDLSSSTEVSTPKKGKSETSIISDFVSFVKRMQTQSLTMLLFNDQILLCKKKENLNKDVDLTSSQQQPPPPYFLHMNKRILFSLAPQCGNLTNRSIPQITIKPLTEEKFKKLDIKGGAIICFKESSNPAMLVCMKDEYDRDEMLKNFQCYETQEKLSLASNLRVRAVTIQQKT